MTVLSDRGRGALGELHVATDAESAQQALSKASITQQFALDFENQVLIVATAVESTGCPVSFHGLYAASKSVDVQFKHDKNCKANAIPKTFLIAATRKSLPTGDVVFRIYQDPSFEGAGEPLHVHL